MDLTNKFIDRIITIAQRAPSHEDMLQVRRCLIDYIGVTCAGAYMIRKKIDTYINLIGGTGTIKTIGFNRSLTTETAAFVNGLSAHAAELDDGDRYGMFHPGAPLFSSLLVLIQKKSISSNQFYKAVISGYEASMLIARSMQPDLKEKGFHGTGFAGTVGAAIACAVAMKANREELTATLSAACTSAAGLLKVIKGKSQMKPLNIAYAAQNGLQAAFMAKAGFIGSADVLDGDMGFIRAFSEQFNGSIILESASAVKPLIHAIYVKPYAACRHCHAPIEAAIHIAKKPDFSADKIHSIVVSTYSWAIRGHDHTNITGMSSAKMSIPYSVAAALLFKNGDIDVFDGDYLTNQDVLALTNKVKVIEDPKMTLKAPGERGARVKVKFKAEAEEISFFVALPKGEPENPVTDSELVQKTNSLRAFAGLQDSQIQQIVSLMDSKQLDSGVLKNVLYSL